MSCRTGTVVGYGEYQRVRIRVPGRRDVVDVDAPQLYLGARLAVVVLGAARVGAVLQVGDHLDLQVHDDVLAAHVQLAVDAVVGVLVVVRPAGCFLYLRAR